MELRFVKFNPSGNTTILILDKLPRERYAEVSNEIMKDTSLCAEQVGFLEDAGDPRAAGRLHMMGGEFCGNASRSFAAWIAMNGLISGKPMGFKEKEKFVDIEVSGYQGILTAKVMNLGKENICFAKIRMPLPWDIFHGRNDQLGEYSIVVFEGILHVILWNKVASKVFVDVVRNFLNEMKFKADCFGIMFFDILSCEMIPVVYVDAVGSLVWENSCGSGTVAVATALAHKTKQSISKMEIHQPGGDLYADIEFNDEFKAADLSGEISITAVGTVYIT